MTISAPLTARSTAAGSPRLPIAYSTPAIGGRDASHHRAHLRAVGDQPTQDRAAQGARRAGDQERHAVRQRELGQRRGVLGVGGARHLLDPRDDVDRVLDRHRRRLAGRQAAVEVGDQVAQALVALHLLGHELVDADRHVDQRLQRVGDRVEQALGGLGQRRRRALAVEHREQVDPQDALGAVDDELALHRLDVPGELELPEAALAADHRAPLVEGQVGIATQRAPRRLDVLDRAEELLDQVEAVHADVAERVAGVAVVRRQRAALERRVLAAAQDVDRDDLPERARPHRVERARHLRVEQERVVDGDGLALGLGQGDKLAALGRSSVTGFSTTTWQPASSAALATLPCELGGVSTWMTLAPAATSASRDG
jgi:hypothetical protein